MFIESWCSEKCLYYGYGSDWNHALFFFFFFKSDANALQIFHDLEIESKSYVCYQFYQETYVLIWESALHISNLKIGIFTNQF